MKTAGVISLNATVEPPVPTGVHFTEALDWFKARVPTAGVATAEERARQRAFTVAGVAQLDTVNEVWKALDKAVSEGTTLADFKKDIAARLESEWGGTVANPGARLETIFRTNVQSAYGAGRYAQAIDPPVLKRRPFWRYDALLDNRTSAICRPLNGKVVAADDPWWKEHSPPLHHGCRSGITTLTAAQAEKEGVTEEPPDVDPASGFGMPPDEDWLKEWADKKRAGYPEDLRAAADEKGVFDAESAVPSPRELEKERGDDVIGRAHAKYVDAGSLSSDEEHDVLRVFENLPSVRRFLRTKKLGAVNFVDEGAESTFGTYDPKTRAVEVATTRPPDALNRPLSPDVLRSISRAASSRVDAIKRSFAHEVGHHIHRKGGRVVGRAIQAAWEAKTAPSGGSFVSTYAATQASDYFAECFAAYVIPETRPYLEQVDLVGYKMVRKVLGALGKGGRK